MKLGWARRGSEASTFELLADVGHFLVNAFLLVLADSGATNVGDELGETSHGGGHDEERTVLHNYKLP